MLAPQPTVTSVTAFAGIVPVAWLKNAREHAVGIYTLSEFYMDAEARLGLIFGYGAIDQRRITGGLARLSTLLK